MEKKHEKYSIGLDKMRTGLVYPGMGYRGVTPVFVFLKKGHVR